jgi:hypothetical protein
MSNVARRTLSVLAFAAATTMLAGSAQAQKTALSRDGRWSAMSEIVATTPTSALPGASGGGDPIYIPTPGKYAGTVGLRMQYANAAFVCSGTLINSNTIVTAAHCVSDGAGTAGPLSTTAFFHNGPDGPTIYNPATSGSIAVDVIRTTVHAGYSGNVVDENDIAILTLGQAAPGFAKPIQLSSIADLTSLDHTIAGYGARSSDGGTNGTSTGFAANTGRLRDADNRFEWRFGDDDFEGYFDGAFGPQGIDNVWISDFDDGTAFRDNSCNIASFESGTSPAAAAIFGKAVFSSGKYCNLGRGAREGIGAGGDSGTGYFIDGKLVAVHSFALWYRDDESANRFGQFKGAVSVDFHRDFINANIPEPATWAMMIAGFGLAGGAVRRSRRTSVALA